MPANRKKPPSGSLLFFFSRIVTGSIKGERCGEGEIVADQLGIDEDDIKLESNFKEDLEADSLDLFELVMALEEEYGVEIPSEDLEKIATVNDIIEYLKNKGVEA